MTMNTTSATVAAKRRMPLKPQKPPAEPKKYPSGASGKHTRPSIVFRPESDEELETITRAAERAGVTRNDWLREAARHALETMCIGDTQPYAAGRVSSSVAKPAKKK